MSRRLTAAKRAELRDRFADLLLEFWQPFCEDVEDLGVTFEQGVEVLEELGAEIKANTRGSSMTRAGSKSARQVKPRKKEIKLSLTEEDARIVHAALIKFTHLVRDTDEEEIEGAYAEKLLDRVRRLMESKGMEVWN
jgi:hypothetical protein